LFDYQTKTKNKEKNSQKFTATRLIGENLVLKIEGGLIIKIGVSTGHQAGDNDFKNKIIISNKPQSPQDTQNSQATVHMVSQ
jgi:hypothetical protein